VYLTTPLRGEDHMSIEVVLLGSAQDAGVPQAGCYCDTCTRARQSFDARPLVCCLGIVDRDAHASWLIDATPDLPTQLHLLHTFAPDCPLRGILITHAHIGHYSGLMHLGREAMNTRRLPVYGTHTFGSFLRANAPWRQLTELANIEWRPVQHDVPLKLSARLTLVPLLVPHRSEYSDTLAYLVRGAHRTMFYCPDIDSWSQTTFDMRAFLRKVDVALLDGTFFDRGELAGRNISEVPHPLAHESVERFQGLPAEIHFIHLNHTNPLWRRDNERAWLETRGFNIAERGQRWAL
jgi:pyrroloquinoline quinone biosynthesis protein B